MCHLSADRNLSMSIISPGERGFAVICPWEVLCEYDFCSDINEKMYEYAVIHWIVVINGKIISCYMTEYNAISASFYLFNKII